MSEPYLGQISMMSFDFAPKGWALCNGQILSIQQNTALFSLLGTTYGGNGTTNFALPDLRSRVPMHFSQGHVLGEIGGELSHTIIQSEMPTHSHFFTATTANASAAAIASNLLPAVPTVANPAFYAVPGILAFETQTMASTSVGFTGGSQPHSNLMPSLCISFIIALQGIFPSRN